MTDTYVLRTLTRGDVFYVNATIGLDWRTTISLVVGEHNANRYPTPAAAQRSAVRLMRVDPDLQIEVVPLTSVKA